MNVLTLLLDAPVGAAGGGSMMWIMLIAMFVSVSFLIILGGIGFPKAYAS